MATNRVVSCPDPYLPKKMGASGRSGHEATNSIAASIIQWGVTPTDSIITTASTGQDLDQLFSVV